MRYRRRKRSFIFDDWEKWYGFILGFLMWIYIILWVQDTICGWRGGILQGESIIKTCEIGNKK